MSTPNNSLPCGLRNTFSQAIKSQVITTAFLLFFALAGFAQSGIVINEFDYDQLNADTREFIELKNIGATPVNLDLYKIVLINGFNTTPYDTIDLPNVLLAAGDYFVICGNADSVANCDLAVSPSSDLIQNGAPDALVLVLNGVVVDAVSYEGSVPAPYVEGTGTSFEDNPAIPNSGISRFPDGTDSGVNNTDFSQRCITPGAGNSSAAFCPAENDDCSGVTPVTLVNGVPVIFTGTNVGATASTAELSVLGSPAVWEAVTLTGACNNLTVDYCDNVSSVMESVFHVYTNCPLSAFIVETSSTRCGLSWIISFNNLPAGTYYLPVLADTSYNQLGNYTMRVTSENCDPAPCTPVAAATPGFSPSYNDFPCVERGVPFSDVINFKNFTSLGAVSGFTINVNYLRIDSITNLPSGFSWKMFPDDSLGAGASGCITLHGTTFDCADQYHLGIWITMQFTIPFVGAQTVSGEASSVIQQLNNQLGQSGLAPLTTDLRYWLRMEDELGACPAVDTAFTGVACDDHDPCTNDVCTGSGCVHTPIAGCSGNACAITLTANGQTGKSLTYTNTTGQDQRLRITATGGGGGNGFGTKFVLDALGNVTDTIFPSQKGSTGAQLSGEFVLPPSQTLLIVAGGKGGDGDSAAVAANLSAGGGGGGAGSGVVDLSTNSYLLIAAGGTGAVGRTDAPLAGPGLGGSSALGGSGAGGASGTHSAGGGGVFSNGAGSNSCSSSFGRQASLTAISAGGPKCSIYYGGAGGSGMGGGAGANDLAGGGGGATGGNGGGNFSGVGLYTAASSFNMGTNQVNTDGLSNAKPNDGVVIIEIICDDGDSCTVDNCSNGVCSYTPLSCDDGDACTVDVCIGHCRHNAAFAVNCTGGTACPLEGGRASVDVTVTYTKLVITAPAAHEFNATTAQFGPNIASLPLSGNIVYPLDSASLHTGCVGFAPGSLTGKVALIDRGDCNFELKVVRAQNAGAIGVIIVNNVAAPLFTMGDDTLNLTPVTIPSVFISMSDGAIIKSLLAQPSTVTGHTPTYTYYWNHGSALQTVSGLPPGIYQVSVSTGDGCLATCSAIISALNCDDGIACTDDACFAGRCLHDKVPSCTDCLDTISDYYDRSTAFGLYPFSNNNINVEYVLGTSSFFQESGSTFDATTGDIQGVSIWFGKKVIVGAPDSFNVTLWSVDPVSMLPVSPIGVAYGYTPDIDTSTHTAQDLYHVSFSSPVQVTGPFAITVQTSGDDTLALVGNNQGDGKGERRAIAQQVNGSWLHLSGGFLVNGNPLDMDAMILPEVVYPAVVCADSTAACLADSCSNGVCIYTPIPNCCIPAPPTGTPGFTPAFGQFACVSQGAPFSDVITLENFNVLGQALFATIDVDFLRVDSITNLPCNLSWRISPGNAINKGETGCITIYGSTNDLVGQYKLGIWITVQVNADPFAIQTYSGEATTVIQQMNAALAQLGIAPITTDLSYWVRVKTPAGGCPAVNITAPSNTACTCTVFTDCNDNSLCTVDLCVNSRCNYQPLCNDLAPCTDDVCNPLLGTCTNIAKNCNDNNACTTDFCDGVGICQHPPVNCNDLNACTDDVCLGGTCFNTQKNCSDGNLCTTDFCNGAGACINTPLDCDDRDACTVDVCMLGNCINTTTVCNDGNPCTRDICSNGVCVFRPIPCNDNNLCTNDVCVNSVCTFNPITCNDGNACTTDACNGAIGACFYTQIVCNDINLCTSDVCVNGQCRFNQINCNDGNACTTDGCNGANGQCTHTPLVCNDNNPCTGDLCVNGQCTFPPLSCNDGNPCTTDACSAGQCTNTQITCNDNNPCTTDACTNGSCSYIPKVCNDNNLCTVDGCVNGNCVFTQINCGDNNLCTTDGCSGGTCFNTPGACNDGNLCTTDACAGTTCVFTPLNCADTDICTNDACVSGNCTHLPIANCCTTVAQCNDNNACTTNSCTANVCVFTTIPNCTTCVSATQCNDNDACTANACTGNICVYTPIANCCTSAAQCNDNDACTSNACTLNVCVYTPIAACCTTATQCNDNNACTTNACSANVCVYIPIANCTACTTPAQCNDNNACTTDECVANICQLTSIANCCTSATQCNDNNACTFNACAGNVCVYTPTANCCTTGTQCDDNNGCTTDLCISNVCTHASVPDCIIPCTNGFTVTIAYDDVFCQGVIKLKAVATAAGATYEWSNGQTTQVIDANSNTTYSVTATDMSGCGATASITTPFAQNHLSSFVILSRKEVRMKKNTVLSGGVGVSAAGGKIKLEVNSVITAAGTFAKASNITLTGGSAAAVKIFSPATAALPQFEPNTACGQGQSLQVAANTTVTLSAAQYAGLVIKANSTVTFTQPDINVENIITNENVTIRFTSPCVKMRICKKLQLGPNNSFNPGSSEVIVFVVEDVTVGRGSDVISDIYMSGGKMTVKAANQNDPNILKGLFIVNMLEAGEYTQWYQNPVCDVTCHEQAVNVASSRPAKMEENDGTLINEETGEGLTVLKAYPNPFSERLHIEFTLPEDSKAKLEIFNVAGQRLASLFEGNVQANKVQQFEYIPGINCDCILIYRLQTDKGLFYGKALMVR